MKKITYLLSLIMFITVQTMFAQVNKITGTVTGAENGEALPGVSVVVKGTTIGAVTNMDGKYEIEVPSTSQVLVFSFVGMKTKEAEIGGRSVIDVQLESGTIGLNEVVVTAMGIEKSKKALTYAVSSVSGDETARKSEPDVLRSLSGKVAGVNITGSSGLAGSATRITIRGASSFLGENQPLIVVDGVPYSNEQYNTSQQLIGGTAYGSGMATLDPNNVESIDVLKGAAASALYGSRAANGVLLITTKTGSGNIAKQGLDIVFNSSYSIEQIANLPDYQNKYGAGADFQANNYNGSWGAPFSQLDSIPVPQAYQEAYPDLYAGKKLPYKAYPNNVKDLFRNGQVWENSVTAKGGNEKVTFVSTISDTRNEGYVPNNTFDRTSISVGGTAQVTDRLKINGKVTYSNSTSEGGIFGASNASDESQATSFARTLWYARNWDPSMPHERPDGSTLHDQDRSFDNPLWSWKHNRVVDNVDRIVSNIGAKYNVAKWFTLSYTYGINNFTNRRMQILDIGSVALSGEGGLTQDEIWSREIESNLLAQIRKPLNNGMNIRLSAGLNTNQREENWQSYFGRKIITPEIYDLDNTVNVIPNGGDYEKRRLIGAYYDLTLEINNYLFLTTTGRNDWSSTLPEENRSYFYPSVSASFDYLDAFNIDQSVISFGTVRASWAQTGNDADPYLTQDVFIINPGSSFKYGIYDVDFPFKGVPVATTDYVTTDPNLNPEFTYETEIGTVLGLLNDRITFDLTWYNRRSVDQIVSVAIPMTTGYEELVTNVGEMTNTGIEIGLNAYPVRTNLISWNVFGTFTKNENEVVSLDGLTDQLNIQNLFGGSIAPVVKPGYAYGSFYGSVTARDDEGNLLINPSTGDMINSSEYDIIGDPNPDFLASLTNSIRIKGFTIQAQMDYRHGGDIYSTSIMSLLGRGVTKDTEDRESTYIIPGVYGNPNTEEAYLDEDGDKIPNMTQVQLNDVYFGNFGINSQDEWLVYDGTVLRLRELRIGYEIPSSIMNNLPVEGIELAFVGRNLWFYAPNIPEHTNFDPEINSFGATNTQGIEYGSAPSVKRFGFNLQVRF